MKFNVCKCPNCNAESKEIKSKIAMELGGRAFDCPNCGEKFATPKDSPLIYQVEEGRCFVEKEKALETLRNHTQYYVPTSDLFALNIAMEVLEEYIKNEQGF
jgi:transcriptional regulator NrdR family protein